jgi:hypothetical protein
MDSADRTIRRFKTSSTKIRVVMERIGTIATKQNERIPIGIMENSTTATAKENSTTAIAIVTTAIARS